MAAKYYIKSLSSAINTSQYLEILQWDEILVYFVLPLGSSVPQRQMRHSRKIRIGAVHLSDPIIKLEHKDEQFWTPIRIFPSQIPGIVPVK